MFTIGIVIFLSVVLILIKLPRRWMLRVLHYDMAIDIAVTVLVLAVHWGSLGGVMGATFAGLLTSLATSGAKRLFGYIADGRYVRGLVNLEV